MLIAIQLAVFVGCIKLLVETERPGMCAGILAGVGGLLALISGDPLLAVLIGAGITFAYCFGWFWLLVRIGTGSAWWLTLAGGIILPILLPVALSAMLSD